MSKANVRSGAQRNELMGYSARGRRARSFFVDFLSKKVCEFSKRANDLVNAVNELEYRVNLRTSDSYKNLKNNNIGE